MYIILLKIKRNIGIISKIRHYVDQKILINLYHTLIYPFFTYGIIVWENAYSSNTNPLFLLQKRLIRLITFSDCDEHTNPLFIKLKIIKFNDIVYLHNAIFVHNFHSGE